MSATASKASQRLVKPVIPVLLVLTMIDVVVWGRLESHRSSACLKEASCENGETEDDDQLGVFVHGLSSAITFILEWMNSLKLATCSRRCWQGSPITAFMRIHLSMTGDVHSKK